ncbi:MAG: HAD family hydrolase [Spirochaetales bacterium]|jgi:putative hydrolase of the HAD superfamily|nr:HAD family hydrolase [Spirochaetales bacterium]
MSLKVAAFDIDGTLYPNSAVYVRAIPFLLRNLSVVRSFSRVRREIRKLKAVPDFRKTQAELLARERGIETEEAARLIDDVFYGQWEAAVRGVRLYPYVREALAGLREMGLKLAVLSDFPVEEKLANWGLSGFWDYARSSEELGCLKPGGGAFRGLVEFFGVEPEEILYVGNNYAYDIIGAKSQGLMAAHITRFARAGSAADFSFSDYRRLGGFIASLV